MAAKKARSPAPAPKTEDSAPATAADADATVSYIRDLDGLITVTGASNRSDVKVKDQVRRILRERHAAIESVVVEQLENGIALEEIAAFWTLETPLLPTVRTRDGRVQVAWPHRIVGPHR